MTEQQSTGGGETYVNTYHHRKPGRRPRSGRGRQYHHHQVPSAITRRIIENTGEYRGGKYVEHPDATTHFVEAKFELGENAAATLHKGDAVIVVGREHTNSWGDEEAETSRRVIEADNIGVDLSRAVAQVRRVTRDDQGE